MENEIEKREYLSWGVHNLSSSLKISETTKTKLCELKLFQSDQIISQYYCREDFSSVSDTLTFAINVR